MMEKRLFGKTGLKVSVLGFGGAEIGFEHADLATVKRLLDSALDAGLNVIDTAACYADSEEKIGAAVGDRRADFYLFTKCGHASGLPDPDFSAALIEKSIDRSLARLRTDYLDLIQLHSCSLEILKQGEAITALERARGAGKVRFIGYSGDGQAARYAVESGRFDTLQTSVNIADQEAITLTIAKAQERQMGVIAKRPLANAAWLSATEPPAQAYHHAYWQRLQTLDYAFLHEPATQAVATALRFTLSIDGVHTAIVGTKNPNRWRENAALLTQSTLQGEEYEAIRARFQAVAGAEWVGLT